MHQRIIRLVRQRLFSGDTTSKREHTVAALGRPNTLVAVLIAGVTLAAFYSALRYGGLWGETDTFARTGDVLAVLETKHLAPEGRKIYPNGYGFQAIALFLSNISGLSVAHLQIFGASLLAVWIALPAWLAYRELAGSERAATLATTLLFIQPEFLFVVMRGTHEKFTRGLMLVCLYLLARSLRSASRPARVAALLLGFYLSLYSIATLNNLLANSFMGGFALAALLAAAAWIIRLAPQSLARPAFQRLTQIAIAGFLLVFLVAFYAYTPAQHSLQFLKDTGDQTAEVVQETTSAVNPYAQVNTGWISREAYLAVSLANWLLLAASAVIWLRISWVWLRRRRQPQPHEFLLWAIYGAFTAQSALSIVVDVSGAVAGTLQHRIFPSFVMLAAPLTAAWLVEWRPRHRAVARLAPAALAALIGALACLSMLKATNEPLVSNKWLFYVPAESQALDWADSTLADRPVWTEYDERLLTAIYTRDEYAPRQAALDMFEPGSYTRDFLLSDVIRARAARIGAPLPVEADSLITYDNGQAQIYHLRPRTPYQR